MDAIEADGGRTEPTRHEAGRALGSAKIGNWFVAR